MLQRIGKYEILERVGRGGQGTVYRARDTGLDRIVAIKVLDQSVADDPGYLDALRREAQLPASLDHPNIVPRSQQCRLEIAKWPAIVKPILVNLRFLPICLLGRGPLPGEERPFHPGRLAQTLE